MRDNTQSPSNTVLIIAGLVLIIVALCTLGCETLEHGTHDHNVRVNAARVQETNFPALHEKDHRENAPKLFVLGVLEVVKRNPWMFACIGVGITGTTAIVGIFRRKGR